MKKLNHYIGVDISKETLDFALTQDGKMLKHEKISNTKKDIVALLKNWQKEYGVSLENCCICMEHTGIYGDRLLNYLKDQPCLTCVENAYHIKHSQGLQRGKNDKIDACRIAIYAWKNRQTMTPYCFQSPCLIKIQALFSQRRLLVKMQKQIKTSLNKNSHFADSIVI